MRLARLSDDTIRVTLTGTPAGATVIKCYLAIKANDSLADTAGILLTAVPTSATATFNITDVQTGTLAVRRYSLSAKAILDDARAIRLDLDDDVVDVEPPGVEKVT